MAVSLLDAMAAGYQLKAIFDI